VGDIITDAKFYENQLRSFGVTGPPPNTISYIYAHRPYNSASTQCTVMSVVGGHFCIICYVVQLRQFEIILCLKFLSHVLKVCEATHRTSVLKTLGAIAIMTGNDCRDKNLMSSKSAPKF